MFKALQLQKTEAGFSAAVADLDESALPAAHSVGLSDPSASPFKNGLAIHKRRLLVRHWRGCASAGGAR